MRHTRRKDTAWLFALILLLELTALFCACTLVEYHHCQDCASCAICEYLRIPLGSALPLSFALTALAGGIALVAALCRPSALGWLNATLIARKVELND